MCVRERGRSPRSRGAVGARRSRRLLSLRGDALSRSAGWCRTGAGDGCGSQFLGSVPTVDRIKTCWFLRFGRMNGTDIGPRIDVGARHGRGRGCLMVWRPRGTGTFAPAGQARRDTWDAQPSVGLSNDLNEYLPAAVIRSCAMPAARRSTARRPAAARPAVDPVWEIALAEIEIQIKTLPPKLRRGSASWLRSARKTIRDAEKALGGTATPSRARPTR